MTLENVNEQRDLLNYEPSHLYNVAKHKGVTLNPAGAYSEIKYESEYGVLTLDEKGRKKSGFKFESLERCQMESLRRSGSMVVRLGRDHGWKSLDVFHEDEPLNVSVGPFIGSTDESGNIQPLEEEIIPDVNVYQLISNELVMAGYPSRSGARPSAEVLRGIAMRYNDIVPEEFAAAVVKHCELPKISDGEDSNQGKRPFKSPEEKQAWYDTPAGIAWVKENPIPSIFNLPTPEYMHRRG